MKRVYVIDDEPSIVESVSMVLEGNGYVVGIQNNDKDVVDNVVEFGADLIILDVMLPEDTAAGFKMARASGRRTHYGSAAPHAHRRQRGRHLCRQVHEEGPGPLWLPVQEFVEKPVVPEVLLAKVKALCPS